MAETWINLSNHSASRNNLMSMADLNVLLHVLDQEAISMSYDASLLINKLLQAKIITPRTHDDLSVMYESGEEFTKILLKTSRFCTFEALIHTLYACNYTDFAERLKRYRNGMAEAKGFNVLDVYKQDGNHRSALEFYGSLKKNIDNSAFKDNADFLKGKTTHLKAQLQNLNSESTQRKRCLIDKLIVIVCLLVEVTDINTRSDVVHKMRKDERLYSNDCTDAPLYDKEASTFALRGNFEMAEQFMQKARLILVNVQASWVVYYHYLNELFLKVAEFKTEPSDSTKQSLLFYGFSGLRSVANEDEDTQRQWKRMYISFMLYGVLCLGLFLEEIDFRITPEDRKLARTLLSEFNRLSAGMETRRDMLYAFFMARLHETDDVKLALTYAKRALVLSENGVLRKGEKENIFKFVSKLQLKV